MVEAAIAALENYLGREIIREHAQGIQTSVFQEATHALRRAIESNDVMRVIEQARPFARNGSTPREAAYELWLHANENEHRACTDLLELMADLGGCDVDALRLHLAAGDWEPAVDALGVHDEAGLKVHCRRVLAAWGLA